MCDLRWDFEPFDKEIRANQARLSIVYQSLRQGCYYLWDYQPLQKASEHLMRNYMDLNSLEYVERFLRD